MNPILIGFYTTLNLMDWQKKIVYWWHQGKSYFSLTLSVYEII